MSIPKQAFSIGARWTAVSTGPDRHFEILSAGRGGFELRCVVSGARRLESRARLTDRSLWRIGWLRLPLHD